MPLPQPPKLTKRRSLNPYVSVWVVLGGFAFAYLTLLGLRPDALGGLSIATGVTDQGAVNLQRNVTRALADLDPLRNTLGEMKMDVANLKSQMQVTADRNAQLEKQLTTLQRTASKAPDNVSGAAAGPQLLNGKQAQANPIDTASISRPAIALAAIQPSTLAPPAAKPRTAKKKAPVKAPVKKVAAKKAPAKKPPKSVGVQLATGPSVASLQLNWSVLADRNKDALGHLQPRYTSRGKPSKRTYDLVVGPLGSTQQAEIICKVLGQRGHSCKVGTFRGNVLPPT
ncbi:MAG: hypothetical protein GY877_03000 [Hyphomicrobium sp.]|nr:hypothetical protein [Hyphomicrobium sp.]